MTQFTFHFQVFPMESSSIDQLASSALASHNVPPTKAPPYSRADAGAPGAHGDAADVAAASSP